MKPHTQKKTQVAKIILIRNNNGGRLSITYLKIYCRALVIETIWYWYENRNVTKGTRQKTQILINTPSFSQLLVYKGAKTVSGERRASLTAGAGITKCLHVQE